MIHGEMDFLQERYAEDTSRLVVVRAGSMMRAPRMLMVSWLFVGVLPFILQTRSYAKFVTPHKITETLVVPPGAEKEVSNLQESCPVQWVLSSAAWWNIDPTHYYTTKYGRICHFVVPQYNVHGNYLIESFRVVPFFSSPSNCANDSFRYEQYLYHGSIGYYSFYEEQKGSYCTKDYNAYITPHGIGTFDMNGSILAEDTGSKDYRKSYWYGIVGAIWLGYRALVLRRSYVACRRFGQKCDQMGEGLSRKEAVVFVQENMRLAAHDATNYQRVVLLYLLVEGLMSDIFLLIANDGLVAKIQYVSLGYNLSGLMLLVFEICENTKWLHEKRRLFIKRLLFSYETAFLGEILSSALQQYIITGLNRSSLKESRPIARAVSYYVWSLVGHCLLILTILAFIVSVRAFCAIGFVLWTHRTWAIFTQPCCVDSTLGTRNKMIMLAGYRWENGNLHYKANAFKALGMLKMEEDGSEFIVLRKLHWLASPVGNLVTIGIILGQRVEPCREQPCSGIVSFLKQDLGGALDHEKVMQLIHTQNQVMPHQLALGIVASP